MGTEKIFTQDNFTQYLQSHYYSKNEINELTATIKQLEDAAKQLKAPLKKIINEEMNKARISVSWLKYKIKGTNWDRREIRKSIEILLKYFDYFEQHNNLPSQRIEKTEEVKKESLPSSVETISHNFYSEKNQDSKHQTKTPNSGEMGEKFITQKDFREFLNSQKVTFSLKESHCAFLLKMQKKYNVLLFETTASNAVSAFRVVRGILDLPGYNTPYNRKTLEFYERFIGMFIPNLQLLKPISAPDSPKSTASSDMDFFPDKLVNTNANANYVDLLHTEIYTFSKPVSFEFLGQKTENINSWQELYIKILSILFITYKNKIPVGKSFIGTGGIDLGNQKDSIVMRRPKNILGYLYLETNLNTKQILIRIKALLDLCNLPYESLKIHYIEPDADITKNKEMAEVSKNEAEIKNQSLLIEQEFMNYLINVRKMTESTCRSYISAIHKAEQFANEYNYSSTKLLTNNAAEAEKTYKELIADSNFQKWDRNNNKRFTNAISKLMVFHRIERPIETKALPSAENEQSTYFSPNDEILQQQANIPNKNYLSNGKENVIKNNAEISDNNYTIVEKIGFLSEEKNGWRKEFNIISWNDKEPEYDIREWTPDHTKMGNGITLTEDEIKALYGLIDIL